MKKIEIKMLGECPRCHRHVQRQFLCTVATCNKCGNPDVVLFPLTLTLLLPKGRLRWQLEKLAEISHIPIERLANALLLEAAKEKLKTLKPLPQITVES